MVPVAKRDTAIADRTPYTAAEVDCSDSGGHGNLVEEKSAQLLV